MLFGASIRLDTEGIPDVTGFREHLYEIVGGKVVWPSVNGPIPDRWPTAGPAMVGFYTIYPNPDQLLAGELDVKLRQLIASAPLQGGVLTAYAEADANPSKGGQFAAVGLTKPKLMQVHAHLQRLCHGTRVKYGAVVCGPTAENTSFCPPGLDYYAIDWYDTWEPQLIKALNEWRQNISRIQRSPVLAIAETNSNVVAHRPSWFSMAYGWLAGYSAENGGRALGFWSYWNPGGLLSGPWRSNDAATIEALTQIAIHCKGDV